jgi:predicted TIM-barrel fold metal-dependent hydrolase
MICDSHVHIVGDPGRYPWVSSRAYTAPAAPLSALQEEAGPLGVRRFVIVQPSFYGMDNRATLDAMAALGSDGRGVAVVDPAVDLGTLLAMDATGVRGLRINLYSVLAEPSSSLQDRFGPIRDIAGRMGWHVQVIAPAPVLAAASTLLAEAGISVVIDHYGLPDSAPDAGDGPALLALFSQPSVWVKLSAPSRLGHDPMAVEPPQDWLAAILAVNADRAVWGSDWPHTPFHPAPGNGPPPHLPWRPLRYGDLLGRFRQALPPGMEDRVLIHNPARLYGFE